MEIATYAEAALGGYVEFHHEPTVAEIVDATNLILASIKIDSRKAEAVALSAAQVIYKTPANYESENAERASMFGPLSERQSVTEKRWTVGVKVRLHVFEKGAPFGGCATLLWPNGIPVPAPLMVIE